MNDNSDIPILGQNVDQSQVNPFKKENLSFLCVFFVDLCVGENK